MNFITRLAAAWSALRTPLGAATREAAGTTLDDDDTGWRSLTGRARRDLTPLAQQNMQKLAAYLWESNALANRLVELPLAFLLAEGVKLSSDDAEHQEWLDAFWHDPINRMDLRLPTFVRELALFGEQCLPAYVNEVNGQVRLGYLDPSLIDDVIVDPGNPSQEIGVRTVKDTDGRVRRFRTILRGDDGELFAPEARALRAGMTSGDAFYFAVNRFAAGRRGRSDLVALMDWLDGYDFFLFDQMERAKELDAFIWDVKLSGASKEEVAERAKTIQRPGRGSVRVHNDMEDWTAQAPSLHAADRSESARMFRNQALGGASMPEHWFGGGGDVNRAAASEMGDPFFKTATMRQTTLRHMLQEIGSYVLYSRARAAGRSPDWGSPAWRVGVQFPEMVTRDVTKLAAALQSTVVAASAALGERLITRATALRVIAAAAARLDIEINPEAELAAVEEEDELQAGAPGAGYEPAGGELPPALAQEEDDAARAVAAAGAGR